MKPGDDSPARPYDAFTATQNDVSAEMVRQIWDQRAAQLARIPADEDSSDQTELVLIGLGNEVYGLDVHYVREMGPIQRITRVPRVPDWLVGVVNLRGRVVSVLDIQRFFGLARHVHNHRDQQPETRYLVVVESTGMQIALIVDRILAVERIATGMIREVPDTIRSLPAEYVRGTAPYGEGKDALLVVLNLSNLLADRRLIIDEELT